MLQKFVFKPGVNREGTDYDNEGGWFDVNLVRFRKGRPEKFGGWVKLFTATYTGIARALHGWVNLQGTKLLGVGTSRKYYISGSGGDDATAFNDITPLRATISCTFAASNGSSTITVTCSTHGALAEDYVTFAGVGGDGLGSGGNITQDVLNQEYQVLAVTGTNTFTITAKDTSGSTVTANASDSGDGGGSSTAALQISYGADDYIASTGWSTGAWGDSSWGSTTAISELNQLRLWTHDNYGEDLIINPRNGGIYYWDASANSYGSAIRAVELAGRTGANLVPTKALQVLTSETDRHLIILGADPLNASGTARTGVIDPLHIVFSDQENLLEFESLSTNTAGSLQLSAGSTIVGAVKGRQEILIYTDTALYSMQFIGPPFTFGVNLINENSGLASPKGAITTPSGVFWIGYENFYYYNGAVNKLPCAVQNYVFGDLNKSQIYKVFAFTINSKSEVGWFYPSSSSTEIDRYVLFNYEEKTWVYGQLVRHAWLDEGVHDYPQATGNNYLYEQETGFDDDGSPMTNVFIESSDLDLSDGEEFTFISRLIPDVKFLNSSGGNQVNLVTKTRNFPGDSLTTRSTTSVGASTQKANIRARGRQIVLRVESDDDNVSGNTGTGWRLGATRLDVRPDGRR